MIFFSRLLSTAVKPIVRDVVIVGGGPAGLSLLAALKNSPSTRHLKCTLVEALKLQPIRDFGLDPPEKYHNRIISLTPKSVQFMREKSGSWDYLHQDRIKFYDNMVAYDSQDVDARIHFDASTISLGSGPRPEIAAMCEIVHIQSSLLKKIDALNEELSKEDQAEVIEDAKVVNIVSSNSLHSGSNEPLPDWPLVTLSNGQVFQTRLLVGADGQNSPVRKFAEIESRGWSYDRFGVVGTLKLQFNDYRDIAWQRFLSTGPLAILPLPEDNATFVWSSTPELAEILMKVDDKIFPQLLNAAMTLEEVDLNYIYKMLKANPTDELVLEEIEWRMSKIPEQDLDEKYPVPINELVDGSKARFPLKFLHADTYIAPRVALVGDAAHTVHPLAGQGLNMGQTDVGLLVEALDKGVERGLDIGSTLVLEKYVATAWPNNHVLMGVCDKLHKIYSTDFAPIVAIRGFGIKSLNYFDFVKDSMVKAISGR